MNSVENFIAIDLRLNWIDVLKVVILLMNYLKKYVLHEKARFKFKSAQHDYNNK